jgi:hypothetical protein
MRLILLLALLINGCTAFGQALKESSLYFRAGGSVGALWGAKLSMERVGPKGTVLSVGFLGQGRRSENLPPDYIPPMGILSKLAFGVDYPLDEYETVYAAIGKVLSTNNHKIKFNLSGGIGFSRYTYPTSFRKIITEDNSENYTYAFDSKNSGTIVLSPGIDFIFGKHFGVSTGVLSTLSPYASTVGFELSFIAGRFN